MDEGKIAQQLLSDCHLLGWLSKSAVLLNRNAALPWFIVVPDTPVNDFLDLPLEHRQAVLEECASVSAFIKQLPGIDKVNFAGLGNVVSAMHLHVIGRHSGDACWPQPVWGNLPEGESYTVERLREWQAGLVSFASLVPSPLE